MKEYSRFSAQITKTLSRKAEDVLWDDEKFWTVHWPAMVDRFADAVEKLARGGA